MPPNVREAVTLCEGARRVIGPADCVCDDFVDSLGLDLPDRERPGLLHCRSITGNLGAFAQLSGPRCVDQMFA